MILVNNYTRMIVVFFINKKSEELEKFKTCKDMVENEIDSKIKCLRSNNEGEFTSKEFMDFYNEHGLERNFSTTRTPQQNGIVKRKNKTIQEMARTVLMDSKLIDVFWVQSMHTTIHI
jgi:transposase InsO family protein